MTTKEMIARTPPTTPAIIGSHFLLEVALGLISGIELGVISPVDGRELFAVPPVVFLELGIYEVVFIDFPAKQNDLRRALKPPSVNSANVTGGAPPLPEHSSLPEPQSPVMQEKFPEESSVQCVRPQNRPLQEAGAFKIVDSFFSREKPVVERPDGETPGHTV
uniref:Uncharacterized protein n=1 Tax=Salix viminalis TaxID=40686 RepID=A0A6N2KGX4_SALVM